MRAGKAVWLRDAQSGWAAGRIKRSSQDAQGKVTVVAADPSNKEVVLLLEQAAENSQIMYRYEPEQASKADLKSDSESSDDLVDDLINLNILNEPEILRCLLARYANDQIYTYTGPILIAVNPFKHVPHLYSRDMIELYFNFGIAKSNFLLEQLCVAVPSPHIYGIATAAYTTMTRNVGMHFGRANLEADQSILISGESGAGKTESTKCILQYLTLITSIFMKEVAGVSSVMDRVIESNPLLEAFGNATTMRNSNSSRFGKFIELNFDLQGLLIGGHMETYMLEKVRLVKQHQCERNYHIFYQMVAGGSAEDKKLWGLPSTASLAYLSSMSVSESDARDYAIMIRAFSTLGFSSEDRGSALCIAAAVIHFGNVKFVSTADGEKCAISSEPSVLSSLKYAAQLLGVTEEALRLAATVRVSVTQNDSFERTLTAAQASEAVDALAKTIYSILFDWVVSMINLKLHPSDHESVVASICVLDIFGFEIFLENSFEQLCINYANEALQHQFNKYVFELEQVEYEREGIEWSFVNYADNLSCLELIEGKGKSVFSTVDDECFIPKGSDMNLAQRMYQTFTSPNFSASVPQKNKGEFCVRHYAADVVYSVIGFVDKNKNDVPKEALDLFCGSSVLLISKVFPDMFRSRSSSISTLGAPNGKPSIGRQRQRPTVCSSFKDQLGNLLERIGGTQPHYVRCIKPKDSPASKEVSRVRVLEQLKCGGILEAVKVARAGFPYRMSHEEFYARYSILRQQDKAVDKSKALGERCQELLLELGDFSIRPSARTKGAQIGKTKVFLPQDSYDGLESARSSIVLQCCILIQALFRKYRCRLWYSSVYQLTLRVKRSVKKHLFRKSIRSRIAKRAQAVKPSKVSSPEAATEAVSVPSAASHDIFYIPEIRSTTSKVKGSFATVVHLSVPKRYSLSGEDVASLKAKQAANQTDGPFLRRFDPVALQIAAARNPIFPSAWSTAKILQYFKRNVSSQASRRSGPNHRRLSVEEQQRANRAAQGLRNPFGR